MSTFAKISSFWFRQIYPVPVPDVNRPSPTIVVNAPDMELGGRDLEPGIRIVELCGPNQPHAEDPPAYVSINPLAEVTTPQS